MELVRVKKGDIVYYVSAMPCDDFEEFAAIVTDTSTNHKVDLHVFHSSGSYIVKGCSFNQTGMQGTWHWPSQATV